MKTGLVLEGGGMRGIYTAGVLDAMDEAGLRAAFDGVIGVSAGAVHGCSFVSGQRGRSIRYFTRYCRDRGFMSVYSLLTTGSAVGEKLCYHDIPEKLDPFDNEAFMASPTAFYVGVTNLETGEGEYPRVTDLFKQMDWLRASASMPYVSRIVTLEGRPYLDGGIADSVPLAAFEAHGLRAQRGGADQGGGLYAQERQHSPAQLPLPQVPALSCDDGASRGIVRGGGALHTARRGGGARLRRPPQPQAGDRAAGARPGAAAKPL